MQKVGSRELKNRLGRYLRAVRKGESLLVTDRGKTVAKLSPPDHNSQAHAMFHATLERLEAEGFIRIARRRLGKFRPAKAKGKAASQIIIEDRR